MNVAGQPAARATQRCRLEPVLAAPTQNRAVIRFLALDCPDELRRARINARPAWRNRDIDEQVDFGRWLRRNIPDRVDTSAGTPEDIAPAIITWIDRHLLGTDRDALG